MSLQFESERISTIFGVPLVICMVLAALIAALLNGQRQLALLSLLVIVVIGGVRLWSRFAAKSVYVKTSLDKLRVFAGDSVGLKIHAKNAKVLPARIRIEISLPDTGIESIEKRTFESGILWHETLRFETSLRAVKRGIYTIENKGGSISDLFGFFPRHLQSESRLELVVYPRIHSINPTAIPRSELFGTPGGRSPVQDPVYLLGTRRYEAKGPARFIHWKASAKRQLLQEKIFQPSEQEKVLIAFDTHVFQGSDKGEDFESAVELAASFAVFLAKKGSAVGLATDGHVRGTPWVSMGRGSTCVTEILERLASIRPGGNIELTESARYALKTSIGVTCLQLTYSTETCKTAMAEMSSRRRMHLLQICFGPCAFGEQRQPCRLHKAMHISEILPTPRQTPEVPI